MTGVISFILVSGIANSSGLTNFLLAASCFWLTSYILINLTVLMLRRRYPNAPGRDKRLTLWGIPQIICIIGDIYMIWNIAEGDARIFIYKIYFALLFIILLFAFFWVKVIKKAEAFRPVSLDEINDVKLENPEEEGQTSASVLVN
jgi:amino acid transporter